jgi:glycine/D-amino acid oxidase-like deaminating enzyme
MQVDYLIIGQGISGTLLSHNLIAGGGKVIVIDDGSPSAASRVAGGVINPVTGQRLVRTWLIERLLPFALDTYRQLETSLGISIVSQCSILDFHPSAGDRDAFINKQATESAYLHTIRDEDFWKTFFRFNYGIGQINPCLLIDINTMLVAWRRHLSLVDAVNEEQFRIEDCHISSGVVEWRGITADNIIFCNGVSASSNPWFSNLPWSRDKGEALIVSIPGLPRDYVYNQQFSILHWKEDLFWVGATHDWKFTDMLPSPAFRNRVVQELDYWLKLPYTIVDHLVAQRPVNFDRKPFVGMHPQYPNIGIFNGMGTKGCSLAPFFAHQFAQYLIHGTPLMPEVDIARFSRVLSR